ncbi:MAG: alpha/beta hydrolase [Pseudomonadota bacterium]
MLKAIATIALLTLALTACASGVPPAQEEAFVFEAADGARVDAFRGHFKAPENRADPQSRMIDLHYVRFPATGENPGAPIVYLAGGPGGSGIETAKRNRFPLFMAMREFGDVIAFDQRGTGASNNLPDCQSSVVIPDTAPVSDQEYAEAQRTAFRECLEFWRGAGVDIYGYTTLESARDLETLRRALGADKLSLWGISYGSHLAMAAAKEMGPRIDRIVLASAEGLDQTVKLPARTDAYFERLQAAINAQPEARSVYPDIKAMIRRVHAKLDQDPVTLNIPLKDGGAAPVLFQRSFMQQVASALIADPQRASMLLGLYLVADNDEFGPLVGVLQRFYTPNEPVSFRPMSAAMDVASGISEGRRSLFEAQVGDALIGPYLNFPMPQLAGVAPELDLGADFRSGPNSSIPTLLLSGTLDGRTYPDGQREALAGFENLTAITVVNAGHNLFMSSPEVTEVIQAFMRGDEIMDREIMVDAPSFSPF